MARSRVRSYYFTKNSTVSKECLIDICSNTDKYTAGRATMVVWVPWNNRNN
jgi:ribosomal protein L31